MWLPDQIGRPCNQFDNNLMKETRLTPLHYTIYIFLKENHTKRNTFLYDMYYFIIEPY